jgi:eukaryotic-like serine/threonine-protein kinase
MVEDTLLQGRYRVSERLATGGMGTVFRATDERLNRVVAVKVLKDELAGDPRFTERFRREARAVASLSHPGIANVFDYGEDDGHQFIVMEYVPGRDLSRILQEEAPMSPDRAAQVAAQVCAALEHAHQAGIIHRDIKPANVIVGPEGRVKVTDFGIARAAGDATLTATGSMLGTAQYLSPEQAAGDPITPASDQYSTGILLYEMLTGTAPFTGDSALAVAMKHVSDDVPPPSARNGAVAPELDEVVRRATARSPGDRFPTAGAMATALTDAVRPTGETRAVDAAAVVAGRGPEPTRQLPTTTIPARPRRALVALFVVLGLIALGLLGWRLVTADETPEQRARRPRQRAPAANQPTPTQTSESPVAETFSLPNVVGLDKGAAEEELKAEGLETTDVAVPSSEEEKDVVVSTLPNPGTEVAVGDTITLRIGDGKLDEGDGADEHGTETAPGQDKKEEDDD